MTVSPKFSPIALDGDPKHFSHPPRRCFPPSTVPASRRRGASVLAAPRSDDAGVARPEDRPLELRLSITPRVIANAVSNDPRFRRSTPSRRFARASLVRPPRALG
jgi:hypothetical protein